MHHNDIQHKGTQQNNKIEVLLNTVVLSVAVKSNMLSFVMLRAVMLIVVMMIVGTPKPPHSIACLCEIYTKLECLSQTDNSIDA